MAFPHLCFHACQDRISGAGAWAALVLAAWNADLQQGLGAVEAMETHRKPRETHRKPRETHRKPMETHRKPMETHRKPMEN